MKIQSQNKSGVGINGTPQQQAIWSEIQNGTTHLIIEARAGAGKTTTLVQAAKLLPEGSRALFCAFNKHIADELQKRLPPTCTASTLHSFGYHQIKKASDIDHIKMEKYKIHHLLRQAGVPDIEGKAHAAIKKLVSLCKMHLFSGENEKDLRYLVSRFSVDLPIDIESVFKEVGKVMKSCAELEGVIDYDDMLWLPTHFDEIPVESFDFVFVDESQDLNACQQSLVMKACPTGRLVVVGDRYQSIYGFTGADSESMDTMEEKLKVCQRGLKKLSLTVTFRCPSSHVALARELVNDIEAAPNAEKGQITYVKDDDTAVDMMKAGDMVICRTNAPLLEIADKLLRKGKKVILAGQEFKDELAKVVIRLHPSGLEDFEQKVQKLRVEQEQESKDKKVKASASIWLSDICDSLLALHKQSASLEELQEKIKKMFQDVDEHTDISDAVLLSSVHKVKGLESETVFIIQSDLMPHPKATEEWQIEQEKNLAYVAVTRAKKNLIFVGSISKLFPRI